MYTRGITNDIFSLLENERKKAIKNFESLFNENKLNVAPTFIWKFTYDDIKKQNYKEATTYIDNLNILLISYYDNINDIFQLAIQILDNNKNDEKNYNEETSTAKKIINDIYISLSEEIKKENNLINI